jgi:V/A-type H+-transporting ATPase subunit I
VLESLKNFITMFLGVVNVFGDIMSYIRSGLGLAGAAISATVKLYGWSDVRRFLMFLAVLVLVFGHGLNFFMMCCRSSSRRFVSIRRILDHLGLTWSGFKYEPFSETVRN